MKKLSICLISILLTLMISCKNKVQSTENVQSADDSIDLTALVTVTYTVHGMTCTGCENAIQQNIKKLPGIAEVKASHIDSITIVKLDTSLVSSNVIEKAIVETGYKVIDYNYLEK